jgi:hypothetical protein
VIFLLLATVSLAARLWVRLRILQRRLDWDDWFIIVGFVFLFEVALLMLDAYNWRRDLSHEHLTPFDFYQQQHVHC